MHLRSWRSSRPRPSFWRRPLGGADALRAGAGLVALAALAPTAFLGSFAVRRGLAGAVAVLIAPVTWRYLLPTLVLAGTVTAVSLAVGVGLAWLVARTDLPGRSTWTVVATLPLSLPAHVAASSYKQVLPALDGLPGAGMALAAVLYPLVFLPTLVALRGVDSTLDEMARSLGDSPARAARRVVLPAVRPAVAAGALLVTLGVLSDFGAATTMGAHTFSSLIYLSYLAGSDLSLGALQSLLLLACTAVVVALEIRCRGRGRRYRLGTGTARAPEPVALGRLRWPALLLPVAVAAVTLGLPVAGIVQALTDGGAGAVDGAAVVGAGRASVTLAGWGAAATVAAALPVALLAARSRDRFSRSVEGASYVAHALPPVVIALSVAFLAVRVAPSIYRRLPVLVFAYGVLFLPIAVGVLTARAAQVPPALAEMARSLGRRPLAVARTVTGPLMAPAARSGLVLTFLAGLKELPVALLVGPFGFQTLATLAWEPSAGTGAPTGVPRAVAAAVLAGMGLLAATVLLGRVRSRDRA